jgi:predicted TIM-barrel fold metal-dependent hydrolase
VFVEQLLPEAPDVAVQIAHLAGSGGYDDATDAALGVFVDALERGDRRVKNVWFDACGITISGMWETHADLIVRRMRQIGLNRIVYGSDAATPDNLPKDALARFHNLPLTPAEFQIIERNVAPWAKNWLQ